MTSAQRTYKRSCAADSAVTHGFLFEIRQLHNQYDMSDPKESSDFYHEVARRLMAFPDEIERNSYLASVAREYHIGKEVLQRQLAKLAMQGMTPDESQTRVERPPKKKNDNTTGSRAEKTLLSWMSRRREIIEEVKKDLFPTDFSEGMSRIIAEKLFEMNDSQGYNPVAVLNCFEDGESRAAAAEILEGEELPENDDIFRAVAETVLQIKTESLERRLETLPSSDMKALQEIMNEKKKVEELRRNFEKRL